MASFVPDGGLAAFSAADPAAVTGEPLAAGTPVEVMEQHPNGWALVRTDHGSTAWVDGRRLVAQPPPSAAAPWAPSHRIAAGGMPAWATPDPQAASVATLDANLEVQLIEQRADGWGRVACSNGWTCWLDARRLAPLTAPAPMWPPAPKTAPSATSTSPTQENVLERLSAIEPKWLAAGGGGLILLAALVPWYSVLGFSISASKLPVGFLVAHAEGEGQPRASALLLAAAALVIAYVVAELSGRRLPAWLPLAGGAVATSLGMFGVLRWQTENGLGLSLGVPMAVLGGGLAALTFFLDLQRTSIAKGGR